MNRGVFWFFMDVFSIILGVSILIASNFRKLSLTEVEQLIEYLIMFLMCISIGFGVYCLYLRRYKILASIGVFSGLTGLVLSIFLIA